MTRPGGNTHRLRFVLCAPVLAGEDVVFRLAMASTVHDLDVAVALGCELLDAATEGCPVGKLESERVDDLV